MTDKQARATELFASVGLSAKREVLSLSGYSPRTHAGNVLRSAAVSALLDARLNEAGLSQPNLFRAIAEALAATRWNPDLGVYEPDHRLRLAAAELACRLWRLPMTPSRGETETTTVVSMVEGLKQVLLIQHRTVEESSTEPAPPDAPAPGAALAAVP